MINKVTIQYLIEQMQTCITSNDVPRAELDFLASEVNRVVDTLNLQTKRCVHWIDEGRFVEAAALSSDCDNLVLLTDMLCKPHALPAWSIFCETNILNLPADIREADVHLLNNAGIWGKTVEGLTSNWIESNILQLAITERWEVLKKLEINDDQNQIWDQQCELLSSKVLSLLIDKFNSAAATQDLDEMKDILHSVKTTSLSPTRIKEERRMTSVLTSSTSELSSEKMLEIADSLSEASFECDFDKQRALILEWKRYITKGGKCPDRQEAVNVIIQMIANEDELIAIELVRKERTLMLEQLLDQKAACTDIEVLYYELKEKYRSDIPINLEERVRYRLNEEKALRRRKTRLIFTGIFSVVLITGSIITLSVIKNNRDESINSYVLKGETCLDNLDFICYNDWLNEVKELQYENVPIILSVISKLEDAKKKELRVRSDAKNAFAIVSNVLKLDRPEKSEFSSNKLQMRKIVDLPLNDLSERASELLRELTNKEIELQTEDTDSLDNEIANANSISRTIPNPSQSMNRESPSTWIDSANKLNTIKNILYNAIDQFRFANKGINNRAHDTIKKFEITINKYRNRAKSIQTCKDTFRDLCARVPQSARKWAKSVESCIEQKQDMAIIFTLPIEFWKDLESSAASALAIQYWRDISHPEIKSYWHGQPWIDNMENQNNSMELKATLENYLQLHSNTPYDLPVKEMLLIVTNQTTNDGTSLLNEIKAFSDINKIILNAERYCYGKGSIEPDKHGIKNDKDVNQDPNLLTPISIGTSSFIQKIELTKLSSSIEQLLSTFNISEKNSTEQILNALAVLAVCKSADRLDSPILSLAACKHITKQLINERGPTLQILAPNFYKNLVQWNSSTQLQINWPNSSMHSNKTTRTNNQNEAKRFVASFPNPENGIKEISQNFNELIIQLIPATIQGIINPLKVPYDLIGNSNPEAVVLINTNTGWIFQTIKIKTNNTVDVKGIISTAPSLIFQRRSQ